MEIYSYTIKPLNKYSSFDELRSAVKDALNQILEANRDFLVHSHKTLHNTRGYIYLNSPENSLLQDITLHGSIKDPYCGIELQEGYSFAQEILEIILVLQSGILEKGEKDYINKYFFQELSASFLDFYNRYSSSIEITDKKKYQSISGAWMGINLKQDSLEKKIEQKRKGFDKIVRIQEENKSSILYEW